MSQIGVPVSSLGDLLNLTIPKMPKEKFSETQRFTSNVVVKIFFSEAREGVNGGHSYEARVRRAEKGTARMHQPYGKRSKTQVDVSTMIRFPWRFILDDELYDELEIDLNADDAGTRIVELMKMRRSATYESCWNLAEVQAVQAPESATDGLNMWGLNYYARPLAAGTAYTPKPTTFAGITVRYTGGTTGTTLGEGAGSVDLNDSANERLRPMAGHHSGEVNEDMIDSIVHMLTRTKFMTLDDLEGKPIRAGAGRYYMLCGHSLMDQFERIVNSGPDDLAGRLRQWTEPSVRGVQLVRAPSFDEAGVMPDNPIIGCWTRHVFGIVLRGRWMKRGSARPSDEAPTTWSVPITSAAQLVCDNPRAGIWRLGTQIAA